LQHIRNFDFSSLNANESEVQIRVNHLSMELLTHIKYKDEILQDIEKEDIPDPNDRRILKNLQKKIGEIESEISNLKHLNVNVSAFDELKQYSEELRDPTNVDIRLDFNIKIRRVIKNIIVKRYSDAIFLVVNYIAINEKQAIVINSKNGEILYMGVQNDDLKTVEHLIGN
ncbi:TPA: recombinase family protein, partial [Escherichia coli]|nr:recombinase family protein [Escherichia coli]